MINTLVEEAKLELLLLVTAFSDTGKIPAVLIHKRQISSTWKINTTGTHEVMKSNQ